MLWNESVHRVEVHIPFKATNLEPLLIEALFKDR